MALLLLVYLTWWVIAVPLAPLAIADSSSPVASEKNSPASVPDLGALTDELQRKRTQAADDLSQIDSTATARKGVPPGVPESEVLERRTLMQQLVQIYARHIDEASKLAETRQHLEEIKRLSQEWKSFPNPPPYSILMVDDLRDEARSMSLMAQGIATRLSITERQVESTQRSLNKLQEQVRQAAERAEGLQDPLQKEQAGWASRLAQLRERVAAARASMLDTAKRQIEAEEAEARERVALLDRQCKLAEQHVTFTEEDHQKIIKRLDTASQSLTVEIDRAVSEQPSQRQALAEAETRLAEGQRTKAPPNTSVVRAQNASVTRLTEAVELERTRYDNGNLQVDLLRQMFDSVRQERVIWDMRYRAAQGEIPPSEERESIAKLSTTAKTVQGWREYGFQQLTMTGSRINELHSRMEQATAPVQRKHLEDLLRAFRHREDLYRRALQHTDSLLNLIEHRQAEFKQRQRSQPLSAHAREWGAAVVGAVRNFWTVELFAAEDTIEVDGKPITGRRSITVGKVLTALVILIGGYWVSVLLARFVERKAITRFHVDPNVANIIRQWALALLFSILVLLTLMSVKIPLTAFAFLGGALAIGVGFGTQNLLKNIISGILLLMERPLRVGDVIEVDSIHGMVTTIGLRSSTIRDSNGVETLIPNSNLLEKNLTNWTYSSYKKRYQLRVKVAQGPATRQIKDLLSTLAMQHGRVLKEPAPYVLLEDISDSVLVFSLQYWIEIGPAIDPATIASDLRFMIDNSFSEAGLALK